MIISFVREICQLLTKNQIDSVQHVLLRPDMYVGAVEPITENLWIYDSIDKKMTLQDVEYVPGLHKIFDEILVNAADNKVRDPSQRYIKVSIDQKNNKISVENDGKGIPIVFHKEYKVWIPELIFGQMMTSSNYNDKEKSVVGGRFGFGAKLCNILSTEFSVETVSNGRKLTQTWSNNMQEKNEVNIINHTGKEYTKECSKLI